MRSIKNNNVCPISASYFSERPPDRSAIRQYNVTWPRSAAFSRHSTHATTFDDLLGISPAFTAAKNMILRVANSSSSIMFSGESGTGKELFARALHNNSLRANKPFVALNCAAIPKDLMSSELFGYRDGAFTGARKGGAMGKFEYAHLGTLLLDEISELPLDAQAILLRVLEERAIIRIGDHKVIPVDVRIITATNRDLLQMTQDHTFRQDLYYRLNVISINLPALRQRRQDIPLLAQFFVTAFSHRLNKHVAVIAPDALARLCAYHWPGNIRQLRNVIEHGVNFAEGNELRCCDLPAELNAARDHCAPDRQQSAPIHEIHDYEAWERSRIWELMLQYRANKTRIAEALGISRGTLYKKIRHYGL